jgi:hypothetical protein
LKNRDVQFTATAQEHVRREKAWWLANRDHPDVFTEELEQALQIIAALPGVGTLYGQSPFPAFAASTSGESPSISITRSRTPV